MVARLGGQSDAQMVLPTPGGPRKITFSCLEQNPDRTGPSPLFCLDRDGRKSRIRRWSWRPEAGSLHGGMHTAFFLGGHFFFEQMVQKGRIRAFVGFCLAEDIVEHLGGRVSLSRCRLSRRRSVTNWSIRHLLEQTDHRTTVGGVAPGQTDWS